MSFCHQGASLLLPRAPATAASTAPAAAAFVATDRAGVGALSAPRQRRASGFLHRRTSTAPGKGARATLVDMNLVSVYLVYFSVFSAMVNTQLLFP